MADIKVAAKEALQTLWAAVCDAFQVKLVSGTNIKTINNESILGSGNLTVGSSYTLPPATTSTLGGIIAGDGLSVAGNGTLSAGFPILEPNSAGWTVYNLGKVGTSYLKIATRVISGSLAVTSSYGGRYISALQTVALPTGNFDSLLYVSVQASSSPGIYEVHPTSIALSSGVKFYVSSNASATQNVTRRLFAVGISGTMPAQPQSANGVSF